MNNTDLRSHLADIIVGSLGRQREPLLADKSFRDLGYDSLDVVEMRILLETKFGVDLEAKGAGKNLPKNLSELTELLVAHLPPETLASLEVKP
jgi:acyl carrier protein